MKYTVISDLHANKGALETFFNIWDPNTQLVCLGDMVGYGPDPSFCVQQMRERASFVIAGNHEVMLRSINPHWSDTAEKMVHREMNELSREDLEWIDKLPVQLKTDFGLLVHGSPREVDEYLFDWSDAQKAFYFLEQENVGLCFYGHTHVPAVFDARIEWMGKPQDTLFLREDNLYVVNPGSLGQPRDGDSRASYCVYDSETRKLSFHRFEYDIESTVRRMQEEHLPEVYSERLYYGR